MHFQPNNDAGSKAQGLKLTPFIGDGDSVSNTDIPTFPSCLKLTPFIGDGDFHVFCIGYVRLQLQV